MIRYNNYMEGLPLGVWMYSKEVYDSTVIGTTIHTGWYNYILTCFTFTFKFNVVD